MYALYDRHAEGTRWRYRYRRSVSLFGCRRGQIPKLMLQQAPPGQPQPYKWRLDVAAALAESGSPDSTLMIDLKPAQRANNLSLYELLVVWGWTDVWTPVMMQLRGLFVDADPNAVDPREFLYDLSDADEPIFSVMYLAGGLKDGKLTGRWTAPGPSSTNGVLMWPDVMKYFSEEAARVMAAFS